jgi:PKD repeat protein
VTLSLTLALATASLLGGLGVASADAATPPVVNRDASTVTSDVLPTAQINPEGWVEDQAIAGDTVYAAGSFSSARPAGAAAGTSESPRHNLLAFSLSTGNLSTTFAPNVNGEVRVLALSPDKSRLYVGGDFTSVDGVTRNHLFAIKTSTGQVDPTFAADVNGPVYGISATAGSVYVGGQFTTVNGTNRGRLAAVRATDGALLSGWTPKTDGTSVKAVLVAPTGNVVVGGAFASIGSIGSSTTVAAPGSASLDQTTGAVETWNVNKVVKQYGSQGSVLSLKTDGTTVYGSGFWYGATDSNFEGAWAVSPSDGTIKWLADCHGDTYDTTVADGILYTASHHHDCSNIGGFPEQTPKRIEWRATAFTTAAQGDVQPNALMPEKFKSFTGYKAPSVVNWFPQFTNPSCPGGDCSARLYANQPTITIESSGDYVVVGGQFPMVNSKAQQGLVRFAKPSVAPKKDGPRLYPSGGPTVRAVAGNAVRVTASPWDRDGSVLSSVELWRTDKSSPVYSATDVTAPWWRTTVAYTDTSVSAGSTYGYYVKTKDADGNLATSPTTSVTTPGSGTLSDSTYSKQVLTDGATGYWRFDDAATSSTTYRTGATDFAGSQDLTLGSGVATTASGAVGPGVSTSGSTSASAATATPAPAPQTFSAEAWFNSTSTSGGQVIGYGNTATTLLSGATVFDKSSLHDRQVYLTPSGQLMFYVNPGSAKSISSPKSYNDGKWHQVVASLSSTSGMVLYVDGAKVASWSTVKSAQDYRGYWRIAGDNPAKLPGGGAGTGYLKGAVDEVSVYPTALSTTQVADHYKDATGTAPAKAPTVAFTTDCSGLACSYDAAAATPEVQKAADPTPTITSYTWGFGDGAKGTGVKGVHTYKKADTYDVALTVTNSAGVDATAVQTVEAQGNSVPVASFTTKVKSKKVSVDASKSTDYDGKVTGYRWTFGDGSTSTKAKTSHSYSGTGSYPVKLTVTDDHGATGSASKNVLIGKALASDAFTRTVSGWGSADKGGSWRTDPTSAFAVADGTGELTLSDAGEGASAVLPKVSTKKANVVGEVQTDKVAAGNGTMASYLLRQRSSGEYRANLVLRDGGQMYLVASRVVDGKETVIKSVEVKNVQYQADKALRVRATISSATKARIRMTVWTAGTKEPSAQLSTTDSTKALRRSGAVGVGGYQSSTATNTPVVLGFDDLLVTSS